jgi:hypothetical protein
MTETNLMKLTQCHGPWSYSSATRQRERNKSLLRTTEKKSIWVRISIMNGNKIVERTRYLFWNLRNSTKQFTPHLDTNWIVIILWQAMYGSFVSSLMVFIRQELLALIVVTWTDLWIHTAENLYQRHASSTSSYPCPKWLPNSQSPLLWYSMGVGCVSPSHPVFVL